MNMRESRINCQWQHDSFRCLYFYPTTTGLPDEDKKREALFFSDDPYWLVYFSKGEEKTRWCSVFTANAYSLLHELAAGSHPDLEKTIKDDSS